MDAKKQKNGGDLLVETLRRNGVSLVTCVPGESFLPVLDALRDCAEIQTIVTRHEGAAANMADAYGKLTGRPGICFVTRGPGATHAANGVHTAREDSTPMILFVGQPDTGFMGRESFQEVDLPQMFGGLAKWAVQIDDVARLPEIVLRAFAVALSGRPGPVVVGLPQDMLYASAESAAAAPTVRIALPAPRAADVAEIVGLLEQAERPLVIMGGSLWSAASVAALRAFAEKFDLPVAASFRRQDLLDNRDPHYVGQLGLGVSPALAKRLKEADLVLALGPRLSETTTSSYTLLKVPKPDQKLIHVHVDAAELGRVYQADLPVHAHPGLTAEALAALPAPKTPPWRDWTSAARKDYLAHSTPPAADPALQGVDFSEVMGWLDAHLPEDAIIANGAGNYTVWIHRFFRYRRPATELAPINGAMGYGVPAAIAAKLVHPERTVVALAGDGCFMMYPQELATAVQYGAAIIIILVNNGILATIRMHQERHFPGRIMATDLTNPDFCALARAFGAHAETVERNEDFPAAFLRAQQSGMPALIELRVDPRQITPNARLT
jgi:acetolactate synthase-1/2/3 large subunit